MTDVPPEQDPESDSDPDDAPAEPYGEPREGDGGSPDEGANPPLPAG